MEYLRPLLGSLRQALDFVSSFTTYLLGNEPHPGAEEPRSEQEMSPRYHHNDSEKEAALYGDVCPRERTKVMEDLLAAEMTPPNQEIQGMSKTAAFGNQEAKSVLVPSKMSYECQGQENFEQKFSVSSAFLNDVPKPGSAAAKMDSVQQKNLEEPTMMAKLCQRKPEESSWTAVAQEDIVEEVVGTIYSQHWKPVGLLAERRELGHMEEAAWTGGVQQVEMEETAKKTEKTETGQEKEQDRLIPNEGTKQVTKNWAELAGEQQKGPEQTDRTRGILQNGLQAMAKMTGNQQLEAEKEQIDKEVEDDDVQREINIAVLNWAGNEEDQVDVIEEEREARKGQPWEEEAGRIREDQERELEKMLWDESVQQRLEWSQCRLEKQEGQEDAAWTGGFLQEGLEEMAKMARGQQLEIEKDQEVETKMGKYQQVETDVIAHTEGEHMKMLEEKEKAGRSQKLEEWSGRTEEGQVRELAEKQRELEEITWTERQQDGALKVVMSHKPEIGEEQGDNVEMNKDQQIKPEKATTEEVQRPPLDKAEVEVSQKEVLEGEEKEGSFNWEPKETVTTREQKWEPTGLEENENLLQKGQRAEDLQQELEKHVKNERQASGENQEEQTREERWESYQEEMPEKLADPSDLCEEMLEKNENAGGQSSQLEETMKNLMYATSVDTEPLAGPRAFPDDLTTLDISAQKERVLLRHKSSIRRAPSLKRSKPSAEAPAQETNTAEDTPFQLELPRRQNPRLSGLGPMHPNVIAELQKRLQKPQLT